jgi:hypothetical protein
VLLWPLQYQRAAGGLDPISIRLREDGAAADGTKAGWRKWQRDVVALTTLTEMVSASCP